MLTGKEFVAKIKKENQALFKASQINVKAYFDSSWHSMASGTYASSIRTN